MGRVQSILSYSTMDGPGTRCVVFLQGCPVGCRFCHNPRAWPMNGGEESSVEQLLRRLERFLPFLQTPGLTISGGEPMAQPEFTQELILSAKNEGWHVALDTSGWGPTDNFVKAAGVADLVILSIKHPLNPGKIIRCPAGQLLENRQALAFLPVPVILRYVLIPDLTDGQEALEALGTLAKTQPNLIRVEILPFNSLAEQKWAKLGWDNPLFTTVRPKVSESRIREVEELIQQSYLKEK